MFNPRMQAVLTPLERAMKKLPAGKLVKFEVVKDMDGNDRDCIIWSFDGRISAFDFYGNYITEM